MTLLFVSKKENQLKKTTAKMFLSQYIAMTRKFWHIGAKVTPTMHELSLALSLLDEVRASAAREGATRVERVHLRLGRMSGIVRDALLFSWDLARADTVASEATLVIDDVELVVWCPRCGGERSVREGEGLTCALCGAAAPTIVRGRELELISMEVV